MSKSDARIDVRGVSHLALVCSDMARTVEFYEGALGFPLIKTMELPKIPGGPLAEGGQHFFFDIGNGDALAFFWWPKAPEAAPGISSPTSVSTQSAIGSMHHVAFNIQPENLEQTARRLEENGIEWYGGPHPLMTPEWYQMIESMTLEQMEAAGKAAGPSHYSPDQIQGNSFCYSLYFNDPDGILLEFCAWLPPYDQITREHEARGASREPAAARS